jgi:hypothetical protein
MKFASRTLLCLMVYLLGLATSVLAQALKLISIEVPGAGTGAGQGTFVSGVTALGAIAGNYVDQNSPRLMPPGRTLRFPLMEFFQALSMISVPSPDTISM